MKRGIRTLSTENPFDFRQVRTPEGCTLKRVHHFEYTTPDQLVDISLYENQDGSYYAIGIPRSERVVVYGSQVVQSGTMAMEIVLDKIEREKLL